MKPSKSIETAMNRERRKELRHLKLESKACERASQKRLTALRKEADKIVRTFKQGQSRRDHRISILEGRLAS